MAAPKQQYRMVIAPPMPETVTETEPYAVGVRIGLFISAADNAGLRRAQPLPSQLAAAEGAGTSQKRAWAVLALVAERAERWAGATA